MVQRHDRLHVGPWPITVCSLSWHEWCHQKGSARYFTAMQVVLGGKEKIKHAKSSVVNSLCIPGCSIIGWFHVVWCCHKRIMTWPKGGQIRIQATIKSTSCGRPLKLLLTPTWVLGEKLHWQDDNNLFTYRVSINKVHSTSGFFQCCKQIKGPWQRDKRACFVYHLTTWTTSSVFVCGGFKLQTFLSLWKLVQK